VRPLTILAFMPIYTPSILKLSFTILTVYTLVQLTALPWVVTGLELLFFEGEDSDEPPEELLTHTVPGAACVT
jgi:hypothetical protein